MTTNLAEFTDLMALEGPTLLGDSPKDIVNYVSEQTYTPASLIAGRSEPELFESGDRLQQNIFLESVDVGEWYNPVDFERDEINPQTAATISSEWRYYLTSLRWNLQEVMHNVQTQVVNGVATHQYGDLMFKKEQNLFQSIADAMEEQYWRVPSSAQMEGANATVPYSIPTFICEDTNTNGVGVGLASDAGVDDWTNLCGLDITASGNTKFDNERLTYSQVGVDDGSGTGTPGATGDLVSVLIRMARRLGYDSLPIRPEYGQPMSRPNVCMTSDLGMTYLESNLKQGQDLWTSQMLGPGELMVAGVVFKWIKKLEDLACYRVGTAGSGSLGTETAAALGGARYYFVSQKGLCPKFFSGMFLTADEPMKVARRPLERVQHYHLWSQLWPTDRRKLGIVSPSIDFVS